MSDFYREIPNPTLSDDHVKDALTALSTNALYLRDFGSDDMAINDITLSLNIVINALKQMDAVYDIDGVLVVNRDY